MSVILDALKKAQNERRDATRGLPYDPKGNSQRRRWPIYAGAAVVLCILLVFLLIPVSKKPITTQVVETKATQVSPAAPSPGATDNPQSTVQPPGPVAIMEKEPSAPVTSARNVKPLKDRGHIGSSPSSDQKEMRRPPPPEPPQEVGQQDGPKVLITSLGYEKINAIYNEAVRETERGNFTSAKRAYQSILAEQPGHVEALNNLGVIAMREGSSKEAHFYFNKALQYKKDYGKAYNNLGLLSMKDGQKRLAEEYFRKSIELEKDGMEPSLNLAALLRTEKRYPEAAGLLEGFIRKNTKNRSLYLSYALIKDDMGQYEEAIRYYRMYLREGGSVGERNEVLERLKMLENAQSPGNR
jgi:hypothetical protein